jgi:cell surface protein SprA
MKNLPAVTTPVQILRLEVWVTNRNGTTTDTRDVVGLMDLAESQRCCYPVNPGLPFNTSNSIYQNIISNPAQKPCSGL